MDIIITVLIAAFLAEITGYWIHRLNHNPKYPYFCKQHMRHHLVFYGLNKPMRHDGKYQNSTGDRFNVLGIGLEWLLPVFMFLVLIYFVLDFFAMPTHLKVTFLIVAPTWGWFFGSYMHDVMHLKNFWMLKVPILRDWYRKMRVRHDIHHYHVTDEGIMPVNFGISFSIFDYIFKTFEGKACRPNRAGFAAAEKRYPMIFEDN